MRNTRTRRLLTAGLLAAAAAQAEDKLKGLEMDVMQSSETPDQATARIALPGASGSAASGAAASAQAASNARDNGSDHGQEVSEQAQQHNQTKAKGGPPAGHPTPPGHAAATAPATPAPPSRPERPVRH